LGLDFGPGFVWKRHDRAFIRSGTRPSSEEPVDFGSLATSATGLQTEPSADLHELQRSVVRIVAPDESARSHQLCWLNAVLDGAGFASLADGQR
jgi:hypothetical protein